MADEDISIQVGPLLTEYEAEIGRLNGELIKQRAKHRATTDQLRLQLAAAQAEAESLRAQLTGGVTEPQQQLDDEPGEAGTVGPKEASPRAADLGPKERLAKKSRSRK